jgi:hypothetical protein
VSINPEKTRSAGKTKKLIPHTISPIPTPKLTIAIISFC